MKGKAMKLLNGVPPRGKICYCLWMNNKAVNRAGICGASDQATGDNVVRS